MAQTKIGRPVIKKSDLRTDGITVPLSPAEKRLVAESAAASGRPVAQWARMTLLAASKGGGR